ncbi:SLC37A3 [Acanthosepion pharaonis]|uniref:SLC37A3 n=1 Tax=Acanthosepion pharaonis TaxID=158019 RepID=A0A812EUH9_ACAPH|nr:SLC37A3 [Sepia pharaonis]
MALSCGGYTLYHLLIFILTFFSYAFFHATRKTLSNVKSSISAEWTSDGFFPNASVWLLPNETWNRRHIFEGQTKADPFLGYLDTGFMLAYSLGLFYSGSLGDKFSLKKVLSFGMITSGIVVYFFGSFTEFKHYYYPSLYVVLIVLNGFCQSVGWPTVIAIMGNWFGKTSRGFILGLWSSCASVGNILGALITAAVLPNGYEYAFLLTSTLLFGLGVVNLFALIDSPSEIEEEVYEYYVERPDAEDEYDLTHNFGNNIALGMFNLLLSFLSLMGRILRKFPLEIPFLAGSSVASLLTIEEYLRLLFIYFFLACF